MAEQETEKELYGTQIRNKVVNALATLLLIIAVCVCLFIAIQVLGNGHASIGGYSFFRVVTGSMEPTIPVGSLILTHQEDISLIEVGDIVSFRSSSPETLGMIITHRVVGKTMQGTQVLLQTQGDANLAMDGYYVAAENLIGKMIWNSGDGEGMVADLISFLTSEVGFLACIALPCLLLSGFILKDCVGKIKGDMQKVMDELAKEEETHPAETLSEETKEETEQTEAEAYAEMYARIREELMEELKQGEHQQESAKEE